MSPLGTYHPSFERWWKWHPLIADEAKTPHDEMTHNDTNRILNHAEQKLFFLQIPLMQNMICKHH